IVTGRIDKFFAEACLLEQDFIKDPDKTVQQVLTEKIANIGENITIRRFVRFERGEGIAKKEENFAEEVMKQING
ncbi:elongation factor Ts, partial [Xanthomonas citri pv. citri]|nr:elongation factor Ts [Xanthomonas citri pv. citri]